MMTKKRMYTDFRDLMMNGSGIKDDTAYQAMKLCEDDDRDMRFKKLLRTIFAMCELSDFELINRVELKDNKTGKMYR